MQSRLTKFLQLLETEWKNACSFPIWTKFESGEEDERSIQYEGKNSLSQKL